jgi:hypothetical protein
MSMKRREFITLLGGAARLRRSPCSRPSCDRAFTGSGAKSDRPHLDSERVEPFVDISGLFAAKCPQ